MSIYTRKEMAMLYDASKCTGCKGCQVACKQWNVLYSNLGMNAFPFSGSYQNPEDLNGSNRLVMTFKEKKSDKTATYIATAETAGRQAANDQQKGGEA